jgi:hypothetical protein
MGWLVSHRSRRLNDPSNRGCDYRAGLLNSSNGTSGKLGARAAQCLAFGVSRHLATDARHQFSDGGRAEQPQGRRRAGSPGTE